MQLRQNRETEKRYFKIVIIHIYIKIRRITMKNYNIRQARISEIQEAMGTGHKSRATIIIRSQQKYDVQNDWVVEVNGRKHEISAYVPDLDKRQFDMVILEDLF